MWGNSHLEAVVHWYESTHPWLAQRRREWPDRRGEFWALCPYHGDREPGSFSFSERGFRCFACDARGGLRKLGEALGIVEGYQPVPMRSRRRREPARTWEPNWLREADPLSRFEPLPNIALDYCHQRGLSDETIARWRLCYGRLPASRAKHPRLILPVIEDGRVVGLRGRAIHPEDTEAKWLQSGGSKTTLFGQDQLGQGRTVIVTEAPLSAILAMQEAPAISAVAGTVGASCWKQEWTERIKASSPTWVLVWYDHDEAGETNGVKVVNELLRAGLRAKLYRWPVSAKPKADLADVVVGSLCV